MKIIQIGSDLMSSEYIPPIITASFALLAAIGAQFLAHYLQNKRIDQEKNNKVYQELIFPFLSEILIFYEIETSFRKGHHIEKKIDAKDFVERISKKIQYSDMKLLARYNELIKSEHFYDAKGDIREIYTLKFFYEYLSYSLEIMEKNKFKEIELFKQIDITRKQYGIWILISEDIGYQSAIEVMSFDFLIPEEFYLNSLLNNLNELISSESKTSSTTNRHRLLKCLVNKITRENKTDQTSGAIAELNAILQGSNSSL